jgi:hypothetical protein
MAGELNFMQQHATERGETIMKGRRNNIILASLVAVFISGRNAIADFTFGEPTNLGSTLNSPIKDIPCSLSADGLALYFANFAGYLPGGLYRPDGDEIWVTRRPTTEDEWGEPEHLGPTINTPDNLVSDNMPHISADGLKLYFMSNRSGGSGGFDIWLATRPTTEDDWGEPENLGPPVNSEYDEAFPRVSGDGLTLVFCDWAFRRPGGHGDCDLWISTRATTDDPWGEPENLGETVNSPYFDSEPCLSHDGLAIVFSSLRPGGLGGPYDYNLWVTTRKTTAGPWSRPKNLGPPVNGSYKNGAPVISADGSVLYFKSRHPGGYGNLDIWQAPIEPLVDLNSDGIVDAEDMCIIVDNWRTDDPLCDIGPMPWGDGVVDVHDLVVIAENLFTCPGAVAHWRLDEAESDIAYDSAGDSNGTLAGGPLWRPTGGMVAGALQLDGVDDYMSTEFVLDPADGPFSAFAWIKGGAPGQAIISQTTDFNWLGTDASTGNLMTELRHVGRGDSGAPLVSQTPITDDVWHRVGVSWDGTNRILYVDDVEVAKDTQSGLLSLDGGLYIGSDGSNEPGTFWSGLIDEVCIYDRAVTP